MRLDVDRPSHPLSTSSASILIGWFPVGNKFSEKKQDLREAPYEETFLLLK